MKYTIIVPIYNCEKYLSRCLNSILTQTYRNFELILINDGSTDNSKNICEDYKKKDYRISVYHIKNAGVSNARNIGINYASGDYITFIDSDDYIEKNTLEQINNIIINEKVDIVKYGYYNTVGFINRKYRFKTKTDSIISKKNYQTEVIPNLYKTNDFSNIWNAVFKKSLIKSQQFDVRLKFAEDKKFMIEALLKSKSIYILNQHFYHYIQNSNSTMNKIDKKKSLNQLLNNLSSNFDTYKLIDNNIANQKCITQSIISNIDFYIINNIELKNYEKYCFDIKEIMREKNIKFLIETYNEYINTNLVEILLSKKNFSYLKKRFKRKRFKSIVKEVLLKFQR